MISRMDVSWPSSLEVEIFEKFKIQTFWFQKHVQVNKDVMCMCVNFFQHIVKELHLLIGFDIYVVLKIYSTWLSYTWLDVESIILLHMWWKIIDAEFHLRKQNTQAA